MSKAFDSVWHEGLWAVFRSYGVPDKLVRLLSSLYADSKMAVWVNNELREWFAAEIVSRQGDQISPIVFITLLERVMETVECDSGDIGVNIHGIRIKDLRFADDIDLLTEKEPDLQIALSNLNNSSKRFGLKINKSKTKVMVMSRRSVQTEPIVIDGEPIEQVTEFIYLGSLITNTNDCTPEIRRRINLANQAFGRLKQLWKDANLNRNIKLELLTTCVFSCLLYAAETWTLKEVDRKRLLAFEMKCYRRIMRVSWRDKVTNDSIRRYLSREHTIIETFKRRKLQLFGHICRMDDRRLLKSIMLGTVDGSRPRGRPARRWSDDIVAWTGHSLPEIVHMASDRNTWHQMVEDVVIGLYGSTGL